MVSYILKTLVCVFVLVSSDEVPSAVAASAGSAAEKEEGVQWLRGDTSSRRRHVSQPSGGGARRRAPMPSPPPYYDSRRRAPVPTPPPYVDSRRRASPSPSSYADTTRRRTDMRRRSSSGWQATDYSRRRGYSGSTVAMASGLGFGAGIAVGTMIQQPGGRPYYYHHQGWTDMNGAYHPAGYYAADGYYYQDARAVGYCPPYGAPDYYANCGAPVRQQNSFVGIILCIIVGIIVVVSLCKSKDQGGNAEGQAPLLDTGDPMTREGRTVARGNAILFLRALEAEYIDGRAGEVGNVFDSLGDSPDAASLQCEEGAVRDAGDPQDAVIQLANRWGMRMELSR